jgi:hypothetical protein
MNVANNMNDNQAPVIQIDPQAAHARNRRNRMMIAGICVIAAGLATILFLVRNTATQEVVVTPVDTRVTGAPTGSTARAQEMNIRGTRFISGTTLALTGSNVELMDIVNGRDEKAFPNNILIANAEVQTVPGDQVFSIGTTPANSVLVKIQEPTQPGNLGENALVVRPGQRVAISGRVAAITSMAQIQKEFGVTGYEAGRLGNTSLVIQADTVQILR